MIVQVSCPGAVHVKAYAGVIAPDTRTLPVLREYLCRNVNFKNIRHQKKAGLTTLRDDDRNGDDTGTADFD